MLVNWPWDPPLHHGSYDKEKHIPHLLPYLHTFCLGPADIDRGWMLSAVRVVQKWAKTAFLHLLQVVYCTLAGIHALRADDLLMIETLHCLKGAPAWLMALPEFLGKLKKDPALLIYSVLVFSHISGVLKLHFSFFLFVSLRKTNRLWLSMLSLWERLSL